MGRLLVLYSDHISRPFDRRALLGFPRLVCVILQLRTEPRRLGGEMYSQEGFQFLRIAGQFVGDLVTFVGWD